MESIRGACPKTARHIPDADERSWTPIHGVNAVVFHLRLSAFIRGQLFDFLPSGSLYGRLSATNSGCNIIAAAARGRPG
jgi:hypothetical protein